MPIRPFLPVALRSRAALSLLRSPSLPALAAAARLVRSGSSDSTRSLVGYSRSLHSSPSCLQRKGSKKAPEDELAEKKDEDTTKLDSSNKDRASAAGANGAAPPAAAGAGEGEGGGKDDPPSTSLSARSVPEVYPQMLALPITRRPLFPGFYKAVVIKNPAVVAAIKEMMKRGQPYIGAFLLKDENADSDMYVPRRWIESS